MMNYWTNDMLYAEHIIGLQALEFARQYDSQTETSVRNRFEEIKRGGLLLPHIESKRFGEDGNIFELDRLAGDNQYVFLSYGARYRQERERTLCYGFLFDPIILINFYDALVGPDMLDEYEDILDAVAHSIDRTMLPLPMLSDAEVQKFMSLMGEDDPEMAAHLQQASTSRYHDLCDAVKQGNRYVEGAEDAIRKFCIAAQKAQEGKRLRGKAAVNALSLGMEILVPHSLSLEACIGTVEAGEIHLL